MSIPANTYHGWFTGGGIEYQANLFNLHGLFFNTEYRVAIYNLDTLVLTGAPANFGAAANLNIHPYVQTITSGLRYKFNWQ
jgi:hypothetical protein